MRVRISLTETEYQIVRQALVRAMHERRDMAGRPEWTPQQSWHFGNEADTIESVLFDKMSPAESKAKERARV